MRALSGDGLKQRVIRSSGLTIGKGVLASALRIGSNLILTRLLFPEAFGLMVIVNLVTNAVRMLSDVGLTYSIVHDQRGENENFLNTAWILQIVRGTVLAALIIFSAPFVARFYEEPQLQGLIYVSAFTLFIDGFRSMNAALAVRKLQLGRMLGLEVLALSTNILVMIAIAYSTGSIYALVLGPVAGRLVSVIGSHVLLKGPRAGFAFDRFAAWSMLTFGGFVFLSGVAGYVGSNAVQFFLSLSIPLSVLGLYSIANTAVSMVSTYSETLQRRVLLPTMAERIRARHTGSDRKQIKLRRLIQAGFLGVNSIIAIFASPLIGFLYDPRYTSAGPILALLAGTAFGHAIHLGYVYAAIANGDGKTQLTVILTKTIMTVCLVAAGVSYFGLAGAILGMALAQIFSYPVSAWAARRYGLHDGLGDLACFCVGTAVLAWVLYSDWLAYAPLFN